MAYIGRSPLYGSFEKQSLSPDGSTTTFSLDYTVGSSSSILVSIAGVIQEPESAYNLSSGGTQIVFASAPGSSDTVFVVYLGVTTEVATLGTGAITGLTELAETRADNDYFIVYDSSAGSLKKIQASNVASDLDINGSTDLAATPASGDEFVVYDASAGSNKKVAYSYLVPTLTYTSGTDTGDGSTTGFTIDSGRSVADVLVYVNGFNLVPTTDYTISGTTLTFQTAPASGAEIAYRYLPLSGTATYTNGTDTGDGSTTGFTIDSGRTVEDVIVTVNGVTLVPSDDYSISGTTLTFVSAPASSAEISYRYLRLT